MHGSKVAMISIFVNLHNEIRDSTNAGAIGEPGMYAAFTPLCKYIAITIQITINQ